MSTGIVILAAGESARMGTPKQLLPCHGTTLLQHTIATACALPGSAVVVVLGAEAGKIRAQVEDSRVHFVENPEWCEGMGGSLRTGLQALLTVDPALSAVIFLVCDQPLLTVATLRTLLATHEQSGCAIVASDYGETLGVPALFASSLLPELLALRGTDGARQIIKAHRANAVGIPFPGGAVDLDTPADYTAFRDHPTPIPV